jgi:hypothetical protein
MSPGLHPLGGRGPRPDNLAKVLAKVYASWSKVIKPDHRVAYVAKMLLNAHRDTHRRSWRRETPVAEFPDAHHRDPVTRGPGDPQAFFAVAVEVTGSPNKR